MNPASAKRSLANPTWLSRHCSWRGMVIILNLKGRISSPERTAERFVENRDAYVDVGLHGLSVACSLRSGSRGDGTERLMIETFADGWWYMAAIPSGNRVLVCMSDAARVRPLELLSWRGIIRLLAGTEQVRRVADLPAI